MEMNKLELIEKSEVRGIKFAIYFRPGRTGGMFLLFVGNTMRTAKPTLKGAQGAMAKIVKG